MALGWLAKRGVLVVDQVGQALQGAGVGCQVCWGRGGGLVGRVHRWVGLVFACWYERLHSQKECR